ncbi:MAG: glycogen debranching enzyme family protein [Planctomycetes bacterium]|nr:glycogen debranching enzyme family protein [Planctomycetota bacterium]
MDTRDDDRVEWLETDGLGGFASGTVGGVRTRRYQGLLLAATRPPTGRLMLVNGLDAWIETTAGRFWLTAQGYVPGTVHPENRPTLESFTSEPWPSWALRLGDGTRVRQECFVRRGAPLVAVTWNLLSSQPGGPITLCVRPLLSGRDYHALHHENPAFAFKPMRRDGCLVWTPYDGVPSIVSCANAEYQHDPHWYRNFLYVHERDRGLDHVEDLAAPGILRFDLAAGEAAWLLAAGVDGQQAIPNPEDALASAAALRSAERRRRRQFAAPLHRAADAYFVQRGEGKTIVAGYPWFTDWGRDTFIALRGLCLATGRHDDAKAILLEWAGAVSEGMLPNRFPDSGETPEYNAVDASLWYIIAAHEFLVAVDAGKTRLSRDERRRLEGAVREILAGYQAGTRYGIRCDDDGLLAAGAPGVQLTWMDAKVGDWVVTPRIGKPVEVQALWLNALWAARYLDDRWAELFVRGRDSFRGRFWSDARGYLYDVVDSDHRPGKVDARFRPNQIFAVGGLPIALFENGRARQIVDSVEQKLWTPLGLRSLAPDDPEFAPQYRGGVRERDGAYHQGTVWPWLIGPFVEAWLRVRGDTPEARRDARQRFVAPLHEHLAQAGVGHLSEVADAIAPHLPGGCPFQAWSLAELLRLEQTVFAERPAERTRRMTRAAAETFAAAPKASARHV